MEATPLHKAKENIPKYVGITLIKNVWDTQRKTTKFF